MKFYGLLYLAPEESSSLVLSDKSFEAQIKIYLKNAIVLAKSLEERGYEFQLLTNREKYLKELLQAMSSGLSLCDINFSRQIPKGIRFYSAHFKLDVYQHLASLGSYSFLCDLDMVCTREMPRACKEAEAKGLPLVYDITDQVTIDYGENIVLDDLSMILGESGAAHWYGGEFIGGSPDFFRLLAKAVDEVYFSYVNVIEKIDHVGDEAVTSAALHKLKVDGCALYDAGSTCIVGRYWNCARWLPFQRSFTFYKKCFLLHLPADKNFLGSQQYKSIVDFRRRYWRHRYCSVSAAIRLMKKLVRGLAIIFGCIIKRGSAL